MAIVVFDGLCNFCSSSVRFILKHDVRGVIRFAPAQSELGQTLLEQHGLNAADAESFLLIKNGKAYLRSDAALEVAKDFGWWRWLRVFRIVPRGLRDWSYSVLARNRYTWFGKRDSCFVPTEEERSRFVDSLESVPSSK